MTSEKKKTAEQWIELIADKELPAITSTAKLLDKFSNDDVSSLPKLSQAILHDQALSSCLLKIANNLQHISVSKVTTVSRASVILGIQSVKNVCLTSRVLEGLLKSKNLGPEVYNRLTKLMATSFYAGLLAKMMVPDYNDDTQEEVYLAAMLYRIGETAFWSSGDELCEKLIKEVSLTPFDFERYATDLIGVNFNELSIGLAKKWNLGSLLEKSLDNPESRTVEMKIIYFADKLSRYIESPPNSIHDFNDLLEFIGKIMQVNPKQLREKINQTRAHAIKLLHSYGASSLISYIKPLPTINDFGQQKSSFLDNHISKEKAQLNAIQQLSKLTQTSKDFNDFLPLAIKSAIQSIGFDRCMFLMLTGDKKQVQSRFSYNRSAEDDSFKVKLDIVSSENIIAYLIRTDNTAVINDYHAVKWRNYITQDIAKLIDKGVVCLAPVKIAKNTIGIIVGQRFTKSAEINEEDYQQFCFFIEHLNMCLTMVSRR